MAEFKLDRFKYTWKGDWVAETDYVRDDIVRVNGKSYVCLLSHTANAVFAEDLNAILPNSDPPQPQPKWKVMTSGRSFLGDWSTETAYNLGDLVVFDGTVWLCTQSHVSTTFAQEANHWTTFAKSIKFVGEWQADTDYGHGAIVQYGGKNYKCLNAHVSSLTLEFNEDDWEEFYEGLRYAGNYTPGETYYPGDLVKYGGSLFECLTNTVSFTSSSFELKVPGSQYDGEWNSTNHYTQGDIVKYGGTLYFAVNNNIDSDPSRAADDSTVDWIKLSDSYNFRGNYITDGVYKTGDVVLRGGYLYVAVRDVGLSAGDDSTLDYLSPEVWELLVPGQAFKSNWNTGIRYYIGDTVYHLGTSYRCNTEHISSNENFPGDNGNGIFFWDTLIQAGRPGGLHDKGDLLTYGLSREVVNDGSTQADIRVPIGNETDVLSITNDLEVFWRQRITDSDVVYVAAYTGEDRVGNGRSIDSPFKSVAYAAQYVEDNFEPYDLVTIKVATGRYEEIAPISVPAGCAIVGDELRATTVVANPPLADYQDDWQYVTPYLDWFTTWLFDLVNGIEIEPLPGNTEKQFFNFTPAGTQGANLVVALMDTFKDYVEFRLADGESDPVKIGTNNVNSNTAEFNGGRALEQNVEFIAAQFYAYMVDAFPDVTFNETKLKADVRVLMRNMSKDMKLNGSNHYTLLAGRRYTNATLGSQNDDLFYMRDTTGLRQMTTEGLTGSLNPPGVFDLYQRPTGGSLVSLDPGWGPEDNRTWIINRSPYIQGVTNIGNNCTGMKVDGSLHNGGNKSMTANDFTQVLSDGIGAWISNNGRAELVSVFTYYCQVGYLAEDGGVIRATNGNNSYGSFGAVADGNDPTEIPQNVTVDNKQNEAQVEAAFVGGTTDRIDIFEYANAGENYSEADATVVGAGANADVDYTDFRDSAIFEGRLINTKGSGSKGGFGYKIIQQFAQITVDATSRLKLSGTDPTQLESEVLGMRIVIIQGRGVGQYGYISGYDQLNREVIVSKESDDTLGWDHVVPGTPLVPDFDSTCNYRIEPRIQVSHPGFSVEATDLSNERTITDATFGGTEEIYLNVSDTEFGSGDTLIGYELARFNVTRSGKIYTVQMIDAGSGYAIGDTITIAGDQLGGATPINDLTIEVTATTDDSTNSIQTFTSSGTPRFGRAVAVANPNYALYSDDGANWSEANLSFTGNWVKVLAGSDSFVAVASNDNRISYSRTGEAWTTRGLARTESWTDGTFGAGRFVIIANNTNFITYSSDGLNWSTEQLPEDQGGDSTVSQWTKITYGMGKYVVVSDNDGAVATSTNAITWSRVDAALPSFTGNIIGLEYGDNRFLVLTDAGETAYSLDGTTWYAGATAPDFSATNPQYIRLSFAQGVFVATTLSSIGEPSSLLATTETGLVWREENLQISGTWNGLFYGKFDATDTSEAVHSWIALSASKQIQAVAKIHTGKRAILRADIFQETFQVVKIWDPGSGYVNVQDDGITPDIDITVTSPGFITDVEIDPRIGDGVLAQPDFINRGIGYRSSTTTVTITGDGNADIIPEANTLTLRGVSVVPGPGVQIRITGILDELTEDPDDLKLFNGVTITDLGDDGTGNNTRIIRMQISPSLDNEFNLSNGTDVELRSQYSQCRITGHDFLDIGTGNFEETNYPEIYAGGNYFVAAPENEVLEENGGRVFYVSTDQDGNFRTGELFSVQQSTGIVTISAEFFDLDGLTEISLGGVRLGGTGAVVSEFSTDVTFAQDSNSVIPTQRAIATFLANRLSVGGENLETNRIVAGITAVGGEENIIETTNGAYLNIPRDVTFHAGADPNGFPTGLAGSYISRILFMRQANETIQ